MKWRLIPPKLLHKLLPFRGFKQCSNIVRRLVDEIYLPWHDKMQIVYRSPLISRQRSTSQKPLLNPRNTLVIVIIMGNCFQGRGIGNMFHLKMLSKSSRLDSLNSHLSKISWFWRNWLDRSTNSATSAWWKLQGSEEAKVYENQTSNCWLNW